MKTRGMVFHSVLAAALVAAPAATALTAGNPYLDTITNRNVFSLKPPPDPAANVVAPPPAPVGNVLLAGITTVLGGKTAVLRYQRPARPPEPAREISLMLKEGGPAEEGVQVLAIDVAAGTVKINNNGTVQTLDISKHAPKSSGGGGAPGAIPVPAANPASAIPIPRPTPTAIPVPGSVTSIGRPIRGGGPGAMDANAGGGVLGAGIAGIPKPEVPPPITLEEQLIMMEVNKIKNPDHPPTPPTELTEILENEASINPGGPPAFPGF